MSSKLLLLQDLAGFFGAWSVDFCFFLHCCWAAAQAKELRPRFLLHFWVTYLGGFGGSLLSSLVLMRPDASALPLLDNGVYALMWVATWWGVNYFPFGVVEKLLETRPVWILVTVGSAFCRAFIIRFMVDLSVKYHPENHVAPLIMGTMASMAGKPASELLLRCFQPNPEPNEIVQPGFVWWSSVQCTLFYYVSVYVFPVLLPEEAWALVCLLLVGHVVVCGLAGKLIDFTVPFREVVMFVANLPYLEEEAKKTEAEEVAEDNGKQSKKNK